MNTFFSTNCSTDYNRVCHYMQVYGERFLSGNLFVAITFADVFLSLSNRVLFAQNNSFTGQRGILILILSERTFLDRTAQTDKKELLEVAHSYLMFRFSMIWSFANITTDIHCEGWSPFLVLNVSGVTFNIYGHIVANDLKHEDKEVDMKCSACSANNCIRKRKSSGNETKKISSERFY